MKKLTTEQLEALRGLVPIVRDNIVWNQGEIIKIMGFTDGVFTGECDLTPEQKELLGSLEEVFLRSFMNHMDNLFRILVDEEPATTVVRDCGDIVWARPDQVPMGVRMHFEDGEQALHKFFKMSGFPYANGIFYEEMEDGR